MKRTLLLAGVVCVVLVLAGLAVSESGPASKSGAKPQEKPLTVGGPISQGNLTVFPVYSRGRRAGLSDYLTLEEALKMGLLTIRELPDAAVSRVSVTNRGRKPVYLMAGDIILGGKQDRIVSRDTIVPPGTKNFQVEVFCVEHGRWTGEMHFSRGEVASGGLRYEAQQTKEQQRVWDRVALEADAMQVQTMSGSYRAVAGSPAAQKDIDTYVKTFSGRLRSDRHAIGLVVAVNGQVTAADIFADNKLFGKQLPKILKSYALDAVQQKNQWARLSKKPKATTKEAMALLRDAERGKLKVTAQSSSTINMDAEGSSTYLFQSAPMSGGMGGGGFGGAAAKMAAPAHRNIFKKK